MMGVRVKMEDITFESINEYEHWLTIYLQRCQIYININTISRINKQIYEKCIE